MDCSFGSVDKVEAFCLWSLLPTPVHASQGQQQDEVGSVLGASDRGRHQPCFYVWHPGSFIIKSNSNCCAIKNHKVLTRFNKLVTRFRVYWFTGLFNTKDHGAIVILNKITCSHKPVQDRSCYSAKLCTLQTYKVHAISLF